MAALFASMALQRKLLLAILLGTVLALLVAALAVLAYENTSFRPRVAAQLEAVSQVMADINQAPLEFEDAKLAQDNLALLKLYGGVDAAALYRSDGSLIADWTRSRQAEKTAQAAQPAPLPASGPQFTPSHASLSLPVRRDDRELGRVWVRVELPPLIQRLPQYGIMFGALALAVLVLGVALLQASRLVVSQPLARLAAVAREVGRTGNYAMRVPQRGADEIGQLSAEFNRMLGVVGERDTALQQAHDELEQRVQERGRELEQAMKILLQSEKLAALGNVVAGVAHELSTPIGNALLAATNLQQETRHMTGQVQGDSLSRRELDEYMESVEEGTGIVARSLERAANLVRSFKSVAVNETSEARMVFDLRTALDDCLALLTPGLKHRPVELHLACPSGLQCDSYPGALTQIVNNLVENAVRHGIEPKGGGQVAIEASEAAGWVTLAVSDDGVGIPPEHLGRIFEPFFTTRLGQGGSGLGLHVVYSLAGGPLGGSIKVQSQVGQGTRFELRFPLHSPDKSAAPTAPAA